MLELLFCAVVVLHATARPDMERDVFDALEVVAVTNLLARIDIDPDGCHSTLFNFRFPQCVSLRDGLNVRSTCRFNALMTARIFAPMIWPP
jgi:hypothetical protein